MLVSALALAGACLTSAWSERATPLYQLAAHLHLEKSTVSRLVQSLVERGWVERTINPDNRREVLLTLTDAGHTSLEEVQAHAAAKYHRMWSHISEDRRAQVLDALATLNTILQEEEQE